jgi:hypothetical protein
MIIKHKGTNNYLCNKNVFKVFSNAKNKEWLIFKVEVTFFKYVNKF